MKQIEWGGREHLEFVNTYSNPNDSVDIFVAVESILNTSKDAGGNYLEPVANLVDEYHKLGALDCDGVPVTGREETLWYLYEDLCAIHPDDFEDW